MTAEVRTIVHVRECAECGRPGMWWVEQGMVAHHQLYLCVVSSPGVHFGGRVRR